MAVTIDKLAVVDPGADIDENCHIGPFCTVGANVQIGANTTLKSHVVVEGSTKIGSDCIIYPFVTLGVQSQDLKYVPGTETYCAVGDRNIIREFVSIHSGTEEFSTTKVGDDCALLAHAHIAHNCDVGNKVIFSHAATIAGHVTIGDNAYLGGLCGVKEFCHVGHVGMIAGMGRVIQDVLPFTIADGFPAHMRVVNRVGMERAGYTEEQIRQVRRAFRTLFVRGLRLEEAVTQVQEQLGDLPHIKLMLEAIHDSQQGIARPVDTTFELNEDDV